jgi:hypothetical protein
MLASPEDWLGRQRPVILGKEGASAAADRGGTTLADILNTATGDDDSFGGQSDVESAADNWVDGVGEGRTDEANLCGYFRMSEGEDEDSPWRTEGISDLSPYQNKALVVGDGESFSLQPSTSSVDEGEPGKVKTLYDIVFEKSGVGVASGLAISAARGNSIDVGVLHSESRATRQKCTVEFWYYLPPSESPPSDDMVLVRRTMGPSADDLSKVCVGSERDSVLWELVLRTSGELEFRTCSGTSFLSSQNHDPNAKAIVPAIGGIPSLDEDEVGKERPDLVNFGKWNHACIVMTSRGMAVGRCSVSLCMKGKEVASNDEVSMAPAGFDKESADDLMQKSQIIFGLSHGPGFRLTEIRIWACERSTDDTQSFLYEYLTAAEAKKKFKVKISNKNKGAAK